MSQHVAPGWPNARNMLWPTMLQYIASKCCDRLAKACRYWANNVGICCVEILRSFARTTCEHFTEPGPNGRLPTAPPRKRYSKFQKVKVELPQYIRVDQNLEKLRHKARIDLFSLSSLFSHCRQRDILKRIFLLSILKLFIYIHANI